MRLIPLALVLSLSLFQINAFCADEPSDMAKKIAQTRNKDRIAIARVLEAHRLQVETAKSARDKASDDLETLRKKTTPPLPTADEIALAAKKVTDAAAALERANKDLEKAQKEYIAAGGTKNEKQDDANAASDVQKEIDKLKADLGETQLLEKFSKAKIAGMEVEQQLELLEQAYDTTRLGAYMREKFERLMSADGICQTTAACAKATKEEKNTELQKITKEMFFDNKGKAGRKRGETREDSH
jgi:hypothetical protein